MKLRCRPSESSNLLRKITDFEYLLLDKEEVADLGEILRLRRETCPCNIVTRRCSPMSVSVTIGQPISASVSPAAAPRRPAV